MAKKQTDASDTPADDTAVNGDNADSQAAKPYDTPNPKRYTAPFDVYMEGIYTKAGDIFVTSVDADDRWTKIADADAPAIMTATQDIPPDVPLENMDTTALQALAASKSVSTAGIEDDRDKLIAAIHAANVPQL